MISLTAATAVCCYILLLIPFLLVNCKNVFVANNLPSLRESGNETELVNAARLSFRLNVSQVTNGRPFHATCNIDRWYGANQKDYIVHFYRTNGDNSDKELVGRHEIYGNPFFIFCLHNLKILKPIQPQLSSSPMAVTCSPEPSSPMWSSPRDGTSPTRPLTWWAAQSQCQLIRSTGAS